MALKVGEQPRSIHPQCSQLPKLSRAYCWPRLACMQWHEGDRVSNYVPNLGGGARTAWRMALRMDEPMIRMASALLGSYLGGGGSQSKAVPRPGTDELCHIPVCADAHHRRLPQNKFLDQVMPLIVRCRAAQVAKRLRCAPTLRRPSSRGMCAPAAPGPLGHHVTAISKSKSCHLAE